MVRFVFYAILLILFTRAMWRFWQGMVEGMSGQAPRSGSVPQRGVHMVRDPVCGTFVVPERAVTLSVGREQLHFCSVKCRDTYRAQPSTSSASSESTVRRAHPSSGSSHAEAEGRTA